MMFDEMSIGQNLHYCEKFVCAEVIADPTKHDSTSIVANHALVCMGCIVFITDQMQTFIRQ
jgi:hypothetical protein